MYLLHFLLKTVWPASQVLGLIYIYFFSLISISHEKTEQNKTKPSLEYDTIMI